MVLGNFDMWELIFQLTQIWTGVNNRSFIIRTHWHWIQKLLSPLFLAKRNSRHSKRIWTQNSQKVKMDVRTLCSMKKDSVRNHISAFTNKIIFLRLAMHIFVPCSFSVFAFIIFKSLKILASQVQTNSID